MRGIRVGVRALALGSLGLTFFASGCGGGGATNGPASCLQVQPCGGDVVGTWKILGGCINSAALTANVMTACPGASVSGSVEISGTATFTDSAYTFEAAETISDTQTLPLSCTGLASCTDLQARITADNPDATVTCSGWSTTSHCWQWSGSSTRRGRRRVSPSRNARARASRSG